MNFRKILNKILFFSSSIENKCCIVLHIHTCMHNICAKVHNCYTNLYINMYIFVCVCVYTYIQKERERESGCIDAFLIISQITLSIFSYLIISVTDINFEKYNSFIVYTYSNNKVYTCIL